jgi:hypothetical protein
MQNQDQQQPLIRPTGDYKKLICYQKAECLYDIIIFKKKSA